MGCSCKPLLTAIEAYIAKADDSLEDTLREAGFLDTEGTVKEIGDLEERIASALKSETALIIGAANDAVDLTAFAQEIWPGVKLTDDLEKKLRKIFLKEFKKFMPGLVKQYAAQIDSEVVAAGITKRTLGWATSWSEELGQIMKLNSHTEIEAILTKGLKNGRSVAEFTQDILDSGIRDEYYKARRVAITETLRAHSYAQADAITQSPAAESKEWVHTGSYRNEPRENHVKLSGTVVPKAAAFELDGNDGKTYYPMFPRDTSLPAGESVNCHCIFRAIASASVLGLPLEERKRLQVEAVAADDAAWEAELDAKNRAKAGIE